jgi:GTP pyrophosphokinase
MLTARFDDALAYASALHRGQVRKSAGVPYVAHLLAVTAMVLEAGADEDVAIAALLHDAVEDQGVSLPELATRFGDRVASIVGECTDTDETPKPPWRPRKEAYLAHLETASTDALLVTAADKLHNARTTLADLRASGPSTWTRFNAGPDEQVWYYRSVSDVVSRRLPGHELAARLAACVVDLAHVASASSGPG